MMKMLGLFVFMSMTALTLLICIISIKMWIFHGWNPANSSQIHAQESSDAFSFRTWGVALAAEKPASIAFSVVLDKVISIVGKMEKLA
jgi:hypothetical protein